MTTVSCPTRLLEALVLKFRPDEVVIFPGSGRSCLLWTDAGPDVGEPARMLLDFRSFETESEARAWAIADAQRRARLSARVRPADLETLVAETMEEQAHRTLAAEMRRARRVEMTFWSWLLRQTTRDDAVGDVARDIRDDLHRGGRPNVIPRRPDRLRIYLQVQNACDGALDAFDTAVGEWRAAR